MNAAKVITTPMSARRKKTMQEEADSVATGLGYIILGFGGFVGMATILVALHFVGLAG